VAAAGRGGAGRRKRRVAAVRYVQGLLMRGQGKSIEPTAERPGMEAQGLQQFVSGRPGRDPAVRKVVGQEIVPHRGADGTMSGR
jgi:SRSO17 transposase